MNARKEEALETEKKIEVMVQGQPDILKGFLNSIMSKSYTTKYNYIRKLMYYFEYISKKRGISNLSNEDIIATDVDDINDYIIYLSKEKNPEKDYSKSYLANIMCALSAFYDYMLRRKLIQENPVTLAENKPSPPAWDDEVIYLTDEEKKIMFDNIKNGRTQKYKSRDRLLILLPMVTGVRVSALVHINVSDIDAEKGVIKVYDKGFDRYGKAKELQLSEEVMGYVTKWLADRGKIISGYEESDALFVSLYGDQPKRLTTVAVRKIVKKYAKGIDKKISPHKLRSTFGTDYYNSCHDIYETAAAMGHKNVQTTRHYAAVDVKRKEEHMSALTQRTLKAVVTD